MQTRKLLLCLSCFFVFIPTMSSAQLIFTSPPRESQAKGLEVYQPIADYLSKVTGQKIVYQYPENWLVYQRDMRKGVYDIVFDGPAFIGWRVENQQHTPLVKLPGKLSFVVVVKKDNNKIQSLKDLAGRTICAFPPPNLAALSVLFEFDNPSRQPLILEVPNFTSAYQGVADGKCTAGILQLKLYEKLATERGPMKVVFTSKPISNQGFTAGPRVTTEVQTKITAALLSEDSKQATQKLLDEFKIKAFEPASKEEYRDAGKLLRDAWGFESN